MVELLVVMAVVAIVMSFAAPSFAPFIGEQRARAVAQHLAADLTFARGEAARQNQRIELVPLTNFTQGWEIRRVSDGQVLRQQAAPPDGIDVCVASTSLAGNLVFRPDGRLVRAAGSGGDALLIGWLGETGDADNRIRQLRINMAGRPILQALPIGSAFVNDGGSAC